MKALMVRRVQFNEVQKLDNKFIIQNTIIVSQKGRMTQFNAKYTWINQVKCNFCFDWINGPNFVKKALNICQVCLQKYLQNQCEIHSVTGESYKLYIAKNRPQNICTKSFIDNLQEVTIEMSQPGQPISTNKIIQQFSELKEYQSESNNQSRDDYYPVEYERKHKANNTKSQFLKEQGQYEENRSESKPHQSCIFNIGKQFQIKEPMSGIKNMKKYNKLQDFGKSLDKTRFLSKYKFYYDQKTIKSFTQSNKKIDRQFGDELTVQEFNLNENETYLQRSITNRSMMSNESSKKYLKVSDEEIRMKIDVLLEERQEQYTDTFKRIVAGEMKEAYEKTQIQNTCLELLSYSLASIDFEAYLLLFEFDNIHTIKLINVGLTDAQLIILLNFIKPLNIESLALTGNKLTENCLTSFLNSNLPYLKQIYLGKNPINKSGLKQNIIQLKSKYILYI